MYSNEKYRNHGAFSPMDTSYIQEVYMSELDYIAIGERIQKARKAQGLTQEAASEKCNVTSSFYGNIERGSRKLSVETLGKISKGLGVSTDVLLFGEDLKKQDMLVDVLSEVQRKADEKQFEKYLAVIKSIAAIIDQL